MASNCLFCATNRPKPSLQQYKTEKFYREKFYGEKLRSRNPTLFGIFA